MRITKMTRLTATTVLAFFLLLLTSMKIETSRRRSVSEKNEGVRTGKNTNEPLVEDTTRVSNTESKTNIKSVETHKDTTVLAPDTLRNNAVPHKATWYRTEGSRVHRPHPTAAYNNAKRGSKLLVINQKNGKSCVVEVTDRMGNKKSRHIDLSHSAFGSLSDHSVGCINVLVKTLD